MDQPGDRLIVALDGMNGGGVKAFIDEMADAELNIGVKVGLDLISQAEAHKLASYADSYGLKVFYDGKFLDIPNTVADAARRVAQNECISMFNVHCTGGLKMMQSAMQAVCEVCEDIPRPSVLGVTILTSLDYEALVEMGLLQSGLAGGSEVQNLVVRLAKLAKRAGLDGVIASPKEITAIRLACGDDFLIVTPGIRPTWAAANDQKRIMTPGEAIKAGADKLVIGRPITAPPEQIGSRVDAVLLVLSEIAETMFDTES